MTDVRQDHRGSPERFARMILRLVAASKDNTKCLWLWKEPWKVFIVHRLGLASGVARRVHPPSPQPYRADWVAHLFAHLGVEPF